MQYCLKLSSAAQNPAYVGVFAGKFKLAFDRKLSQIPPLGLRVHPDLHAIGFKQKDTVQCSISATPPWLILLLPQGGYSSGDIQKQIS